jgi:hypothetical protein
MFTQSLRFFLLGSLMLGLTILLTSSGLNAAATYASTTGMPEQVVLNPSNANLSGVAPGGAGNTYLSPVIETDQPFTHMMLQWEGSGTLALEVRSSIDGTDWLPWQAVVENPDLWVPEDGPDISWSQIIYSGEGATFWQVRAFLTPGEDGQQPSLRRIEVNTVDGRYSETQATVPSDAPSIMATAPALSAAPNNAQLATLSKPAFVSRTGWGSPDGQGSRVPPAYRNVTHMVVHHTAGGNTFRPGENDWGDRVRAIWSFHTITRGWGDIGYNFIIAPDGTIYEGRSGGDDAVGFHDTANFGSMGVSIIGTYSSVQPTAASQESLIALLAWKAVQKNIDPLATSYYYGCEISPYCSAPGAQVATISGHRHITPRTSCPGDALAVILPTIRNSVKERMAGGSQTRPDDGDLVIDEREEGVFARSDANWYDAYCGNEGHTYYTFTTDNEAESTNSATWRPNIPQDGRYRVYASIPQGCGLFDAPYATERATYRIFTADGAYEQVVDHNTAEPWVDLGIYTFAAGNSGAIELYDYPAEPFSARKVMFFDSIKWVPADDEVALELIDVQYERDSVAAGELLKVTFTVKNNGAPVEGQAPQAKVAENGTFDALDGYVYDEGECFLGFEGEDYPAYPKETDRVRITLGPTNRTIRCNGETGGYPWRWGINGRMETGETRAITGYVRFRNPGTVELRAGLIEEYVKYHTQDIATTTITVTEEQTPPVLSSYDTSLRPRAHVYTLQPIPFNLLERTRNPLSITRGDYVGSIPWDGTLRQWDRDGPLGQRDSFLVEQTRIFTAPVAGEYTFRTTNDDGSWLWVDDQLVIINHGLPDTSTGLEDNVLDETYTRQATGTISLDAGLHVLSYKYFEHLGTAAAGYDVRLPGQPNFTTLLDGFVRGERLGNAFIGDTSPEIVIGASDLGGTGIASIRYSLDGGTWKTTPGQMINLGRVMTGTHTLRYQAVDSAGTESPEEVLTFSVTNTLELERLYLPLVQR